MKNWKKLLLTSSVVASLLVSGSIVGAAPTQNSSAQATNVAAAEQLKKDKKYESRLDEIIARGYIRVGTPGDYKPFTYLNPKTKQYEGYDIDVMKELAKDLGVEVRFVETSWSNLMNDLLADKFDIAAGGVSRNTDRQKKAYMTEGYIGFGKSPLIRKADKDKYKSLEDINKKEVRIGVNPGGTNQIFVNTYLKNATVTVVPNNLDVPGLVANGTYDVMITDNIEAITYAKADDRLYAALTDNTFTKSEKAYMIQRGDFIFASYLDVFLDEMRLQGKFDELAKKWL
ncbi:transporter substrate-binding domain-containing protein [Brevibacillus daliensis]|uniref:transporter substrate-binding domain-containing protein n=1 Tax=Brevibacillus daliensis TaxID=2892995 RepID=UPI001E56B476|nr:transporter substrate-binding domain-containing protein [Brevibacillus daliensis]